MGSWVEGVWEWNLRWRCMLFVWEQDLVVELLVILHGRSLLEGAVSWSYKLSSHGVYWVRFTYDSLKFSHLLTQAWKSWAPSKSKVFSWQLLLGRIPTKANLLMCGVIIDPASYACVLCGVSTKLANHLFVLCGVASKVWYMIHRWLGWDWVYSRNLVGLFWGIFGVTSER